MVKEKNTTISKIIIITGLSGSGKSIALAALEDLGYFCIDNLSPNLIIDILNEITSSEMKMYKKLAISIDIRSIKLDKNYKQSINKLYNRINSTNIDNITIYLQSTDKVLLSRFNATRRLHPLTTNTIDLQSAIKKESDIMIPLKEHSNLIIDTDSLQPIELKRQILSKISKTTEKSSILIKVQSFGYKNNIPSDSDFVFDVRCLKNPFWEKKLRNLTGKDKSVISYIEKDETAEAMRKSIITFLKKWIPKFLNSDRKYLTISIGCTGGKHRSVYITEKVCRELNDKYNILMEHRDIK